MAFMLAGYVGKQFPLVLGRKPVMWARAFCGRRCLTQIRKSEGQTGDLAAELPPELQGPQGQALKADGAGAAFDYC